MARDYKRSARKTKRKSESSPWAFLASGFGLGLVAALGLYWHLKPAKPVAPDRPVPNVSAAPQSSIDTNVADEPEPAKPELVAAPATSGTPTSAAPVATDPDYQFYEMLPNFEVVVSDENNQPVTARPSAAKPAASSAKPAAPSTYILQAGSFKKHEDADRRKAQLAFKGIESKIQRVVLNEGDTWYRVYVGPGTDIATFENMRSDLRRANIDVLLLKVRQ